MADHVFERKLHVLMFG